MVKANGTKRSCDNGGRHAPSAFAGIVFLYDDAILQHLLYESDIYTEGSAD